MASFTRAQPLDLPRALAVVAAAALAGLACPTDDQGVSPPSDDPTETPDAGDRFPFEDVELTRELEIAGLEGDVHVVRGEQGIPHIYAESAGDLFFAQGYVTAHDRLFQMDLLRRLAAGRLAELFGSARDDAIASDLEARMHMREPLAEETLAELEASGDPRDEGVLEMLERYADGVNAYADALGAGDESLHEAVTELWDPDALKPWRPVDSLVLGRFMAFDLSYDAPTQIENTRLFDDLAGVFADPDPSDEALAARAGAHADLLRHQPIRTVPTVDGFPGASEATSDERAEWDPDEPGETGARAPRPSPEVVADALATFSEGAGALRTQNHLHPNTGSNAWAMKPDVAGGEVVLAGDQHLELANPSSFYPSHLIVPGELSVQGVVFPGIPGIVLGHNGRAAWTSTTARHDVTDVYHEEIVPCAEGDGDCVVFDDGEVPIESRTEVIDIGLFGSIAESMEVDYESVPHHGPFVPSIDGDQFSPRGGENEALSVRYTGYEPTHEIRAFYDLMWADNVDDAFEALESFQFGAQDFLVIDQDGTIGWTSHADVPARAPDAHTFHPTENPGGLAPWRILPGDGSAEWEGLLSPDDLPRVKDPESGFFVTANADPVGATFGGDPLSGPEVDDRPLYFGGRYAHGLRAGRITDLIRARTDAGEPVQMSDTVAAQHDTRSTFGEQVKPALDEALSLLSASDPPEDVSQYLADVGEEERALMEEAAERIADWSLETPPAVTGEPSDQEVTDSVATTIFNAWMHFFIERALADAYAAAGIDDVFSVREAHLARAAVALMADPKSLESDLAPETEQPILCDDMDTTDVVESCDRIALEALELAVSWAAGEDGFETTDTSAWRWGERHTLTLEPLVPVSDLEIGPFARAGESSVVSVSPSSFRDLSMHHRPHGPAQRFIAHAAPGSEIRAKFQLPGGVVFDPESPHYRDFLDEYFLPGVHAELPFSEREIADAGSQRWRIASGE